MKKKIQNCQTQAKLFFFKHFPEVKTLMFHPEEVLESSFVDRQEAEGS